MAMNRPYVIMPIAVTIVFPNRVEKRYPLPKSAPYDYRDYVSSWSDATLYAPDCAAFLGRSPHYAVTLEDLGGICNLDMARAAEENMAVILKQMHIPEHRVPLIVTKPTAAAMLTAAANGGVDIEGLHPGSMAVIAPKKSLPQGLVRAELIMDHGGNPVRSKTWDLLTERMRPKRRLFW